MPNRRSLALRRNDANAPLRPYTGDVLPPANAAIWSDDFERPDGGLGPEWMQGHLRANPDGDTTHHFIPQPPAIVDGHVEGVEEVPTSDFSEIWVNDVMTSDSFVGDQFIEMDVANYHQDWNTSEEFQVVEGHFYLYCQANSSDLRLTGVDCEFRVTGPAAGELYAFLFQQNPVGALVNISKPEDTLADMGWPDNGPKLLRLEVSQSGHVRFLCDGNLMIDVNVPSILGDRMGFGIRWKHTDYAVPGATGNEGGSLWVPRTFGGVTAPEVGPALFAGGEAWADNFERPNGPPGPYYLTPTPELVVATMEPVPLLIVNGALECVAGVTGPVGFGQGPFGTMRFGEY